MEVNTESTGAMDVDHLRECLLEGKAQGKSAIINVNVGTTVKGAVDSLDDIIRVLEELGYSSINEESQSSASDDTAPKLQYYIHVDGALFGLMLPFVNNTDLKAPVISFKKNIDSISVSGHKFIGAPVPCGVVVTRKKHMDKVCSRLLYNSGNNVILSSSSSYDKVTMDIEYLNSRDATIMGSRNGHAALYIW